MQIETISDEIRAIERLIADEAYRGIKFLEDVQQRGVQRPMPPNSENQRR